MAMMRNKNPVRLVWAVVDLADPDSATTLGALAVAHGRHGDHKLSVSRNASGTLAVVKVSGVTTREVFDMPAVLRAYDERDLEVVRDLVNSEAWGEAR
jgi:hypothetical protein